MDDKSFIPALSEASGGTGKDGADGKVYVPHIDEHKVLTFTIEDTAGEVPDAVDLNPNDEWSGIDESEAVVTDYVWDTIEES